MLFGLIAPLLVLVVAFAIDSTAWYRDAAHLQQLADRIAVSAAPLWAEGDHQMAFAVVKGLVAVDGELVSIDYAGAARTGDSLSESAAFEIAVSSDQKHLLVGMFAVSRQSASAVAVSGKLVG